MTEPVWKLLNDLEDLVQTGYRTAHPEPPDPLQRSPAQAGPPAKQSPAVQPPGGMSAAGAAAGPDAASNPGAAPADGNPSPQSRAEAPATGPLEELAARIRACTACGLHSERQQAVPGTGSVRPLVCAVGEAPGADEDRMGLPFVGPSGQYLDRWLKAVDLSRHRNVYITNIVKCRPPGNRNPSEQESATCIPYLNRQIELLDPPLLLALGRTAAQTLLGSDATLGEMRGRLHHARGIPLVVTYHPSAVLRNPDLRGEVWKDLQFMRDELMKIRSDYTPQIR